VASESLPVQRNVGNLVIVNPPLEAAVITGISGKTKASITHIRWMYLMRWALSNDLEWRGNCTFQNNAHTWHIHHTDACNRT